MRSLLAILLLLSLAPTVHAQFGLDTVPEEVVTWTAAIRPPASAAERPDTFERGERAFVALTAEILDGWRVYALDSPGGLPLTLALDPLPEGLSVEGAPGQSATARAHDPVLEEDYSYHAGRGRVWQALRIASDAPRGPAEVTGSVRYAACNDEVCLPPRDVPFRVRLVVR